MKRSDSFANRYLLTSASGAEMSARSRSIKLIDGKRFLNQLGIQEKKRMSEKMMMEYVDEILLTGESSLIYEHQ